VFSAREANAPSKNCLQLQLRLYFVPNARAKTKEGRSVKPLLERLLYWSGPCYGPTLVVGIAPRAAIMARCTYGGDIPVCVGAWMPGRWIGNHPLLNIKSVPSCTKRSWQWPSAPGRR